MWRQATHWANPTCFQPYKRGIIRVCDIGSCCHGAHAKWEWAVIASNAQITSRGRTSGMQTQTARPADDRWNYTIATRLILAVIAGLMAADAVCMMSLAAIKSTVYDYKKKHLWHSNDKLIRPTIIVVLLFMLSCVYLALCSLPDLALKSKWVIRLPNTWWTKHVFLLSSC